MGIVARRICEGIAAILLILGVLAAVGMIQGQ